jgi:uncharacterized damage-inducible protein DinB
MDTSALLIEAYGRIQELVHEAIDGLDTAGLIYRPEPGANSIAWLVWHLSRVQDDHVSEIAGTDQVWADPGWAERTGIARGVTETGFGDNSDDVAAVVPESVEALVAYHAAVEERTVEYLEGVDEPELDRIIDRSYDPPVSVGVRLVSVISDNIQHAGQARYLRGIVDRLPSP